MYGNEYHIVILISKLHDLMHPAPIILHPDQTSEHTHTVVDVNNIITYCKRCKVVDCELFTLLHRPSDADTMESVEYLMIAIAADLIVIVYETIMKITARYEFWKNTSILR